MTTHPSLLDLADGAAEAIRALNHATIPGAGELRFPSDVCEILGALSMLANRLPQLVGQLAGFLDGQQRAGALTVDGSAPSGNPAILVATIAQALDVAACRAGVLGCALDAAHQSAAHLAAGSQLD